MAIQLVVLLGGSQCSRFSGLLCRTNKEVHELLMKVIPGVYLASAAYSNAVSQQSRLDDQMSCAGVLESVLVRTRMSGLDRHRCLGSQA